MPNLIILPSLVKILKLVSRAPASTLYSMEGNPFFTIVFPTSTYQLQIIQYANPARTLSKNFKLHELSMRDITIVDTILDYCRSCSALLPSTTITYNSSCK